MKKPGAQSLTATAAACAAALIFSAAAAVQLNDPDAVLWVSAYGATALYFFLVVVGKTHETLFAAATGAAIAVCKYLCRQ